MEGVIAGIDPTHAIKAVTTLSDAVRALNEAVAESKRNDEQVRDIVTTIMILAPIAEKIMSEPIHSKNERINQSFIITIDAITRSVDKARMEVYTWLVKNRIERTYFAADMARALKDAHETIQLRFQNLSQLQIDRIDTNVREAQEGIAREASDIRAAIQSLYDLQSSTSRDNRKDVIAIARAAIEREKMIAKMIARATVAREGKKGQALKGHGNWVVAVAWSPDGRLLATASWDTTAAVWDAATGARLRALEGHGDYVRAVAWSPDGRLLATASDDKTAAVWDAATGARLRALEGHGGFVRSVAWSPDGRLLATASYDKTARIWAIATTT